MNETVSKQGYGGFTRPPGIVTAVIDPESGMIATAGCPDFRDEEFVAGTQPTKDCDRHDGGFFQEIKKLFHL